MAHKTQMVRGIPIDVGMVELIQECWRLGWETAGCCQGTKGYRGDAVVTFAHLEDALQMWAFIKDVYHEDDHRITVQLITGAFPDSVQFDKESIGVITEHLRKFPSKRNPWL